jgi:hypothetical protein
VWMAALHAARVVVVAPVSCRGSVRCHLGNHCLS